MHHLRRHVVGRVVAAVRTQEDPIVYGKVGTSAAQFEEAVKGKTIRGAHQQGKYFWLEMSSPPHPLMHFGMTGWIHFSDDDARPYKATKKRKISGLDGDEVADDRVWPPNFWKFNLAFEAEGKEDKHAAGADNVAVRPACEVAFVDSRRLARVRLVDVAGDLMRKTPPLSNNGPDPVLDRDLLNVDWLAKLLRKKKVPIKALLLDQGNISGIGNWVA